MTVESVKAAPRTWLRALPWVLLGVVVAAVVVVVMFLRTPALVEGSFQNFPGAVVAPEVVTYDLTETGEITYVLSAKNTSNFRVEFISAATENASFSTSSVDLGQPGEAIAQHAELNPGDEVRFFVRGTLGGCSAADNRFTAPVPSVLIAYRQFGIERVATIGAGGHAVLHTC